MSRATTRHGLPTAPGRSASAQRTALRGLLSRFFGGSAEDLVIRLVEDGQITPDQLEEIRQTFTTTQPPHQRRSPMIDILGLPLLACAGPWHWALPSR